MSQDDYSAFSLAELFRQEAESQLAVLAEGLVALERSPGDAATLESLMRAAHSLKGAARIVGLDAAVRVSHVMEDCFVIAQGGGLVLCREIVDALLAGIDLLRQIAQTPEQEVSLWEKERRLVVEQVIASIQATMRCELPAASRSAEEILTSRSPASSESATETPESTASAIQPPHSLFSPFSPQSPGEGATAPEPPSQRQERSERVLRVSATNLNRLLALAGEALVEARWLGPFTESLLRLKRQQMKVVKALEEVRDASLHLAARERDPLLQAVAAAQQLAGESLQRIGERHEEVELFSHRFGNLSSRLYREVLASRMRPFADGLSGMGRLVRDLARQLGKEVRLKIEGESTQVDRDVLERLESVLTHLLQNAVDHAMESPEERLLKGKEREGVITIDARHVSGLLSITVADDGRGVDLAALRGSVVEKGLATEEMAARLSEEELLEFLFLPGFSMRPKVTELSGRGVGLDVVHDMVRSVGGRVLVSTLAGHGTRFQLQLPLTISVKRALLAEIAGEPYAFPLARVERALMIPFEEIETVEGREYFTMGAERIGVVPASQLFGKEGEGRHELCPIVVLGDRQQRFGLTVDALLGEQELVVQPLDPRLGKIQDISSGALMPDGSPVLMVDVDDLLRSIEARISGGGLKRLQQNAGARQQRRRRVLVVDDSLTVRELERKLLADAGYEVETAVDGMDGWNAVRTQAFDLVLTDIDMPRLDGIELVRLIRADPRIQSIPVMIVSYKDRQEDRHRGLEAGADYYLTKGSFHDATLLNAVTDLIGPALEGGTPRP